MGYVFFAFAPIQLVMSDLFIFQRKPKNTS